MGPEVTADVTTQFPLAVVQMKVRGSVGPHSTPQRQLPALSTVATGSKKCVMSICRGQAPYDAYTRRQTNGNDRPRR